MVIDDPLGAIHTAVANFNGVTIGDFIYIYQFLFIKFVLQYSILIDNRF